MRAHTLSARAHTLSAHSLKDTLGSGYVSDYTTRFSNEGQGYIIGFHPVGLLHFCNQRLHLGEIAPSRCGLYPCVHCVYIRKNLIRRHEEEDALFFSFISLIAQALVWTAEVASVRHHRLWPRSLDAANPIEADAKALRMLAREQERIPSQRVTSEVG